MTGAARGRRVAATLLFSAMFVATLPVAPAGGLAGRAVPMFIALGGARLDPATFPIAADAPAGIVIVQATTTISDDWRAGLEAAGAMLLDYVPENGFLAWHPRPGVLAAAVVPGGIRAVAALPESMKSWPETRNLAGERLMIIQVVPEGARATPEGYASLAGGTLVESYRVDPYLVLRIRAPATRALALASLPEVAWVEDTGPHAHEDEQTAQITAGIPYSTPGYLQWLQSRGVNGSGIVVGHIDGGVDDDHLDLRGRVLAFTDPNAEYPDWHGTATAGLLLGTGAAGVKDANGFTYGLGVAPGARLVTGYLSGASGTAYIGPLVQNGSTVASFSWKISASGNPGYRYGAEAREYDSLVIDGDPSTLKEEPLAIAWSAGNDGPGPRTITNPKCAKNIIAVGNANSSRDGRDPETLAASSSRGPCEDGRLKPEISAPGEGARAPDRRSLSNYTVFGGTSGAAPHVAGGIALLQQWYRTQTGTMPRPSLTKAMVLATAHDMTGPAPVPNHDEGWGRIATDSIIGSGVRSLAINEDQKVGAGQTYSFTLSAADPGRPLRISLAWTDKPAAAGANPALVSDLDLQVTGTQGTFLGNFFQNGWSATGGSADRRNNVENAFIQNPSGAYTLTVLGHNTPQGAQPFSLFAQNAVDGRASITIDAPKAGDVVRGGVARSSTWRSSGQLQANSVELALSRDGGATWDPPFAAGQPANGSLQWSVPAIDTAVARLRASGRDAQGATVSSSTGDFLIDSSPPSATAGPVAAVQLNASFPVGFVANDSGSGVASVQLYHRAAGAATFVAAGSSNASPIVFNAPGEGRFELAATATDRAGIAEPTPSVAEASTRVDLYPPEVVSLSPRDGTLEVPSSTLLSIVFSEPMDRVSVEGSLRLRPAAPMGAFTWSAGDSRVETPLPSLAPGVEYVVEFGGRDTAGRLLAPHSARFTTASGSPASVQGRVTDLLDGSAIAGALVEARAAGVVVDRVAADASGAYAMGGLGPGPYTLVATAPGRDSAWRNLTLVAAETATVDFALARSGVPTGMLSGLVVDSAGGPVEGARVEAAGRVAESSGNGSFTFVLPAGKWTVKASKSGFLEGSADVAVETGRVSEARLVLRSASGRPGGYDVTFTLIALLVLIAVVASLAAGLARRRRRRDAVDPLPHAGWGDRYWTAVPVSPWARPPGTSRRPGTSDLSGQPGEPGWDHPGR